MKKGLLVGVLVAFVVAFAGFALAGELTGKCPLAKIEKGWWCDGCKAAVAKEDLKDGKCAKCKGTPVETDLCIATGYVCEKDGVCLPKAGDCEKCKGKLVEKVIKAKVVWACPDCAHELKQGDKCEKCKKDAEKTCSASGKCPHASEKK